MKYRGFWALSFALFMFLTGCITDHGIPVDYSPQVHEDDVRKQVIHLASIIGIPEEKIKGRSTKELLVDIEIQLNETYNYKEDILTADEMEVLSSYLNYQRPILRKIKNYHIIVQKLRDKKIIVLPESHQ